jgi:hypothetical protein
MINLYLLLMSQSLKMFIRFVVLFIFQLLCIFLVFFFTISSVLFIMYLADSFKIKSITTNVIMIMAILFFISYVLIMSYFTGFLYHGYNKELRRTNFGKVNENHFIIKFLNKILQIKT